MGFLKYPYYGKLLIQATQELHKMALHDQYDNLYYFQVNLPEHQFPFTVTIMGSGGEAYGLNIFCGPDGLEHFRSLNAQTAQIKQVMRKASIMGYEMVPFSELEPESKKWIKKTDCRIQKHELFPDFMVAEPGYRTQLLKDKEVKNLLYIVNAIIKLAREDKFDPSDISSDMEIFTVDITGEIENPNLSTQNVKWKNHLQTLETVLPEPTVDSALSFTLSALPKRNCAWIVGSMMIPSFEDTNTRSAMLILIDLEKGPIGIVPVEVDTTNAIWHKLVQVFQAQADAPDLPENKLPEKGIPTKIFFVDNDLYRIANATLSHLSIECKLEEPDSKLAQLLDEMEDHFYSCLETGELDSSDEDDSGEDFDEEDLWDQPPAPDDIQGWKEIDGMIRTDIDDGFQIEKRYRSKRATQQYFGKDVDADYLFEEYENIMIIDAYAEWFTTCYRSSHKSQTIAEKWLTDNTFPPAAQDLIQARIQAAPSFYRVEVRNKKKGQLRFENLLKGPDYVVTDFGFASCIESGMIVPARVFPAGDFHFFTLVGPVLPFGAFPRVLDYYDYQNINLSQEELHQHPYILGWLWDFYDTEIVNAPLPILNNTDGDPMLFHTARYQIQNRSEVHKNLKSLDFLDFDDHENCYIWFRKGFGQFGSPEQRTLLGRLWFEKEELLVETNSQKRHEKSRKWLEKIPGVTFTSVSTRDYRDELSKVKRGSRPEPLQPADLPIEAKEDMRKMVENYYRTWLDTPIPMLDNLSPRQAAKKEKYHNQIIALIRTMPKPTGNLPGIPDVPKEQMLKELGLK